MVEVEFKMELSDYLQILSGWLKKEGLHILQIIQVWCVGLLIYGKNQYLFLKTFKYNKANIKAHLMEKAARFFGVELAESKRKNRSNAKPFRSKFRLNNNRTKPKDQHYLKIDRSNSRKKQKNNRINVYHAPE